MTLKCRESPLNFNSIFSFPFQARLVYFCMKIFEKQKYSSELFGDTQLLIVTCERIYGILLLRGYEKINAKDKWYLRMPKRCESTQFFKGKNFTFFLRN